MNFHSLLFKTVADARQSVIGILGGGGKTTLLHRLAQELSTMHRPVIMSSLTKDGVSDDKIVHFYSQIRDPDKRAEILDSENPLYIMDDIEDEHKLLGLNQSQLEELNEHAEVLIFECDGARKRPIKAHQPYDPVIPDFATHSIIVVGAEAVGARIESKHVHRPELFREIWDVNANYELEPEFIAKVLTSHYGYLQKVPADAQLSYFINKADTHPEQAMKLARALLRVSNAPVFYGSLEQNMLEQVF